MISSSDLRDALSVADIIERYGLRAKRRGSQYRLTECPRCHERSSREAIAIDARSGQWLHHGHEKAAGGVCSGDILDLVAACEGLDCGRDFPRVVEAAQRITGALADVDIEERRRRAAERAAADAREEAARHAASRSTASTEWERLPRRCSRGEAYLLGRGLSVSDDVRFPHDGIAVAVRDPDGTPISVVTRRYEGLKVCALKDCTTKGTMIDATRSIVHGRDIVITEGVVDSLTARAAWPSATVLGANGAGAIPRVAEMAIIRAKLAATRIFLVPHDDEEGIAATTTAGRLAIAAGLELGESLFVVSLPAKDLNDAWRQGWRP